MTIKTTNKFSTYHAHAARRDDPTKLSIRARRDAALLPEVRRVFDENFRVYGVRKIWRQMTREGHRIARCTMARLMRRAGLQGVIRGKSLRTTISDKAASRTFTLGDGKECACAGRVKLVFCSFGDPDITG